MREPARPPEPRAHAREHHTRRPNLKGGHLVAQLVAAFGAPEHEPACFACLLYISAPTCRDDGSKSCRKGGWKPTLQLPQIRQPPPTRPPLNSRRHLRGDRSQQFSAMITRRVSLDRGAAFDVRGFVRSHYNAQITGLAFIKETLLLIIDCGLKDNQPREVRKGGGNGDKGTHRHQIQSHPSHPHRARIHPAAVPPRPRAPVRSSYPKVPDL